MSTSWTPLNCVICTGFSIPSTSTSTRSNNSLDEKLVLFFLKKFLQYPLIITSSPEEPQSAGDDKTAADFLQDFVKNYGTPTEWIWFCPSCLPTIREARDLSKKLKEIEAKLNLLRNKVESKVVESFENDGEKRRENGNSVFRTVRQKVFEQKTKKAEQSSQDGDISVKVKEEYPSETEEDTKEVGSPFYTNMDSMSPGYPDPVIYPNVKLEVEEGDGAEKIETSSAINSKVKKSDVASELKDGLRETIYERRSRRQVTYKEMDKSDFEDEDSRSSRSRDSSSGSKYEVDGSGSESDNLSEPVEPSNSRKTRASNSKAKPRSTRTRVTVKDLKSRQKRARKITKKVKPKPVKKVRPSRARKNDGRGGHRIKSSVDCRTCPVCQQVFGCHSKMNVHLNVKHLRNVLFNCDVCKKGFMRKDYLRTHMEIHLPEEDRLLKQALRELKGSEKAVVSEQEKDDSSLESRTCTVCGKSFDKVSILKIHVDCVHTNVMAYECKICNKKFKWKDLLKKHMILHKEGESKTKSALPGSVDAVVVTRSFRCTYEGCEASFRRKRDLEVHCRIHSGAKDFLCALCGISFRHEWSFRRHNILRHQAPEAKKYQCESCGKTFKIKWLLDQHLMSKSHGGAGLPKRTRRKAKDKETATTSEKYSKPMSTPRIQIPVASAVAPTPTSTNAIQSERSIDNSASGTMDHDHDNYSTESQSPVDHNQDRRYETSHMQQYYQHQNFRPDLLNLLPHRDILNYSNFGVPNTFGGFGYNVPSNDSQSQ